jgi:hypothetical protein
MEDVIHKKRSNALQKSGILVWHQCANAGEGDSKSAGSRGFVAQALSRRFAWKRLK